MWILWPGIAIASFVQETHWGLLPGVGHYTAPVPGIPRRYQTSSTSSLVTTEGDGHAHVAVVDMSTTGTLESDGHYRAHSVDVSFKERTESDERLLNKDTTRGRNPPLLDVKYSQDKTDLRHIWIDLRDTAD
ncbi:hypothetical protein ST47_g966 [Ascochyta rabiei]|uniref:Uncharacterized protein n=1 Tax=Didymella rabiei TaxID=5454 RepID=A0A163LL73_DIDRA|nr:hypothetical protein ST47_g966 [Ascochyta rabiei]